MNASGPLMSCARDDAAAKRFIGAVVISQSAAARAVGVTETAIRHAIKTGRLRRRAQPRQCRAALSPGERAQRDAAQAQGAGTAVKRLDERLLACRGELTQALPHFEPMEGVANAGVLLALPAMIEQDVIPEARRRIGAQRRLTLVFDREAWSPESFRRWHTEGVDVITYRKGKQTPWETQDFRPVTLERDGQSVTYWLAERSVQVISATKKKPAFWMREIRRLSRDGHQTAILTTRQDLPFEVIAERMFARWRQENFFKYMQAEFNLDHLSTYATEPADPERSVPNPERKTITQLIKVVAYRSESCLASLVEPFFARSDDEVRAFLKTVFRLPGDLLPDHERHELRVRLDGLANNRSQKALIALCDCLNAQQAIYPGTDLRLVFEAIQSH